MHTIDTLQGKKALLVAQRDQLMGQFNMTNGAIAMVDELLQDMFREAETQKQLDQVAKDMATEAMEKARLIQPAPEMPAVSHFKACPECPDTIECEDIGCAAVLPIGASA